MKNNIVWILLLAFEIGFSARSFAGNGPEAPAGKGSGILG